MRDDTRKVIIFLVGLLLVSIFTILGTVAFFEAQAGMVPFIRNVIITDIVFIVLFVVWVKVNRNYETIYKSKMEHELEHGKER